MNEVNNSHSSTLQSYRVDAVQETADKTATDELQELIKARNIVFVLNGKALSDEQVAQMITFVLPVTVAHGSSVEQGQTKAAVDSLKRMLNNYADKFSGVDWSVKSFSAVNLIDRTDIKVLEAFYAVMDLQSGKKDGLRNDLKSLAAELKIFGVIQSKINAALAAKENIRIGRGTWTKDDKSDFKATAVDLMDKNLYGYQTGAEWEGSAEYKLLTGLDTYRPGEELVIKDFLTGSPKESGAMKSGDLNDEYKFEKENNPLANLATTVGDRSRPVSDRLNEKTTLLNDVSSRYNAAIEAMNKFIDKYNSILTGLLRAI